jgi:hypothetical protein
MKKIVMFFTVLMLMGLCVSMSCKGDADSTAVAPLAFSSENASPTSKSATQIDVAEPVYICKSAGASRYHFKEDCSGLKRCKHTIEKTTVKQAEASGLTLCKYEY